MKKNSHLELAKVLITQRNASIGKECSFIDEIVERAVTRIQRDLGELELILEQSNQSLKDVRQDLLGLSQDIVKLGNYSS